MTRSPFPTLLACAVAAAIALAAPAPTGAQTKIHVCPQQDGTIRYQDRPCGPAVPTTAPRAAPEPPAPPEAQSWQEPPGQRERQQPAEATGSSRTAPPARGVPAERSDYVELNAARCREGNRRACAAVTCERSGNLASRECQAAVGWLSGPGWRARPRGDLYAPGVSADDYELRCTADGRSLRFLLVREDGAAAGAATQGGPRVTGAELERFARESCAG